MGNIQSFLDKVIRDTKLELDHSGVRLGHIIRQQTNNPAIVWVISKRVDFTDSKFAYEISKRLSKNIVDKIGEGKIKCVSLDMYRGVDEGALAEWKGLFLRAIVKRDGDLQIDCMFKGVDDYTGGQDDYRDSAGC